MNIQDEEHALDIVNFTHSLILADFNDEPIEEEEDFSSDDFDEHMLMEQVSIIIFYFTQPFILPHYGG